MPPRTSSAISNSMLNLSNLLQNLPTSTSAPAAFTRCSACLFSTSTRFEARKGNKRKSQDPYREAQARQRKNANIAKQKALQAERQTSMGDPVRSRPTNFIQSLQRPSQTSQASLPTPASSPTASDEYLNFYLTSNSFKDQIARSKWLTEPITQAKLRGTSTSADIKADNFRKEQHESQHANAERALRSITALGSGSNKDRVRVNVQRCIAEFGRHHTDTFLPPKPVSLLHATETELQLSESEAAAAAELAAMPKRVGADTGSSEVQIALLTAKINNMVVGLGKKDMHNKRALRLNVHKRQKLLKYLYRKERGGPRWTNLVEKLGISDAMWKGEISM